MDEIVVAAVGAAAAVTLLGTWGAAHGQDAPCAVS